MLVWILHFSARCGQKGITVFIIYLGCNLLALPMHGYLQTNPASILDFMCAAVVGGVRVKPMRTPLHPLYSPTGTTESCLHMFILICVSVRGSVWGERESKCQCSCLVSTVNQWRWRKAQVTYKSFKTNKTPCDLSVTMNQPLHCHHAQIIYKNRKRVSSATLWTLSQPVGANKLKRPAKTKSPSRIEVFIDQILPSEVLWAKRAPLSISYHK